MCVPWEMDQFVGLAQRLSGEMRNAVFDQVVYQNVNRGELQHLVHEHLFNNVIKVVLCFLFRYCRF